jgi:two-component system, NtrC family, sensor kinase
MGAEQIKSRERPTEATRAVSSAIEKGAAPGTMYDLSRFTLADMVRCGSDLRRLPAIATSQEAMAGKVVHYLYEHLGDRSSGMRACVLVRFFKTLAFAELPPELQEFARTLMPMVTRSPDTRCLTLLASAGEEPQWNSRLNSQRHKTIPLLSDASLKEIPMIAQLLGQLGVRLSDLTAREPEIIRDLEQKAFNVFHVPVARNSPFIPAQQEFVVPYGVESVLGFGAILPDGNLFAVILFTRVAVAPATADMFRTVALNVKMALLPSLREPVFIE